MSSKGLHSMLGIMWQPPPGNCIREGICLFYPSILPNTNATEGAKFFPIQSVTQLFSTSDEGFGSLQILKCECFNLARFTIFGRLPGRTNARLTDRQSVSHLPRHTSHQPWRHFLPNEWYQRPLFYRGIQCIHAKRKGVNASILNKETKNEWKKPTKVPKRLLTTYQLMVDLNGLIVCVGGED